MNVERGSPNRRDPDLAEADEVAGSSTRYEPETDEADELRSEDDAPPLTRDIVTVKYYAASMSKSLKDSRSPGVEWRASDRRTARRGPLEPIQESEPRMQNPKVLRTRKSRTNHQLPISRLQSAVTGGREW